MAKQREGVYERIIECARKEFLEKGYMDASLRTIATQAGTTTGSIYTRFKDKEGLFEAIVGPHYDHIMSRFCQVQERIRRTAGRTAAGKYGEGIRKLYAGNFAVLL